MGRGLLEQLSKLGHGEGAGPWAQGLFWPVLDEGGIRKSSGALVDRSNPPSSPALIYQSRSDLELHLSLLPLGREVGAPCSPSLAKLQGHLEGLGWTHGTTLCPHLELQELLKKDTDGGTQSSAAVLASRTQKKCTRRQTFASNFCRIGNLFSSHKTVSQGVVSGAAASSGNLLEISQKFWGGPKCPLQQAPPPGNSDARSSLRTIFMPYKNSVLYNFIQNQMTTSRKIKLSPSFNFQKHFHLVFLRVSRIHGNWGSRVETV